MGYKFKDFGQRADSPLPMSIQTVFNGVNLDNQFSNADTSFVTLSTSGRELVSQTYQETEVYGRQVPYVEDIKIGSRLIKVRCLVKARTNALYRRIMEQLNKMIVVKKFADLSFTDDASWKYKALLIEVTDDLETSNKKVIELTFYCADPYKYSGSKSLSTTNAKALTLDTDYPIVPDKIVINFSSQPDVINIHNTTTGKKIIYDRKTTVVKSNQLIINQKDFFIGYIANQNSFINIDIKNSDFNSFMINNGDQIVVTPTPTSIELTYKGVKL